MIREVEPEAIMTLFNSIWEIQLSSFQACQVTFPKLDDHVSSSVIKITNTKVTST